MRRFVAVVWLAGCVDAPCVPLDEVPIWGNAPEQEDDIRGALQVVSGQWVDMSGVCLRRIEVRSDLGDRVGTYTEDRRILIDATATAQASWAYGRTFTHELCHAWDDQSGYDSGHDPRWPVEHLGADRGSDAANRREFFADACELGPVYAQSFAALAPHCGIEVPGWASALIDEVFLPQLPWYNSDATDPAFTATDPGPGPGWVLVDAHALDDQTGRLDYAHPGQASVVRYVDLSSGALIGWPDRVARDRTASEQLADDPDAYRKAVAIGLHPDLPSTGVTDFLPPYPSETAVFTLGGAAPHAISGACADYATFRWATAAGLWLFADLRPGARWWHVPAP